MCTQWGRGWCLLCLVTHPQAGGQWCLTTHWCRRAVGSLCSENECRHGLGHSVMSAHTPMWVCLPPQCGQQEGRWTCPVPRSHSPPPGTSLQPLCSKWSHVTSYDKRDERSSGISLFRVKAWTQGAVRLRQALSLPGHRRPLVQRLSSCQSLAGAS